MTLCDVIPDVCPLSARVMWWVSKRDIRRTVRKVCRMVLRDASVDDAERARRAEALLELGEIYLNNTTSVTIDASVSNLFEKFAVPKDGLADIINAARAQSQERGNPFAGPSSSGQQT